MPTKPKTHSQLQRENSPFSEFYKQQELQNKIKYDKSRPNATDRGYDSKWKKARKFYLIKHPLCVECEKDGRTEQAIIVDHIIPHKRDKKLFWDSNNWQSLCFMHHQIKTAKERREGGGNRYHSEP